MQMIISEDNLENKKALTLIVRAFLYHFVIDLKYAMLCYPLLPKPLL